MNALIEIAIQIAIALVIAITTAYFTAKLSYRSFFKQEIWLRKEKEYSQLIEGLCTMKNYYNHEVDEVLYNRNRKIKDEYKEELYRVALNKFDLIRAGSGLLLDPNVKQVLDQINTELCDVVHDSYFDYVDSVLFIINESLTKIKEIAIKDLKIKTP